MADNDVHQEQDPILKNLGEQLQVVQDSITDAWNRSDANQHCSADLLAVFRELCESQRIILATMHDHHIFIKNTPYDAKEAG